MCSYRLMIKHVLMGRFIFRKIIVRYVSSHICERTTVNAMQC